MHKRPAVLDLGAARPAEGRFCHADLVVPAICLNTTAFPKHSSARLLYQAQLHSANLSASSESCVSYGNSCRQTLGRLFSKLPSPTMRAISIRGRWLR